MTRPPLDRPPVDADPADPAAVPMDVDALLGRRLAQLIEQRKLRREADAQTRAALEGRRRHGVRARHTRKLARSAAQQANATPTRAGKRGGRR